MDRHEVEAYFRKNPPDNRVDMNEVLDHCERAARRHAREDAWLAAKAYALDRAKSWKGEPWSPPASESFVTGEVCHELAWQLQHHEPSVDPGAEEHLVGRPVRDSLPEEAWQVIRAWVLELAAAEEHSAWREIVRFTNHHAKDIIRREGFTRDAGWDEGHQYAAIAAHVAQILAHEYSVHAHPR
jgi:hypothetical protein